MRIFARLATCTPTDPELLAHPGLEEHATLHHPLPRLLLLLQLFLLLLLHLLLPHHHGRRIHLYAAMHGH